MREKSSVESCILRLSDSSVHRISVIVLAVSDLDAMLSRFWHLEAEDQRNL